MELRIINTQKIKDDINEYKKDYKYFYKSSIIVDLDDLNLKVEDVEQYFKNLLEKEIIKNFVILDVYQSRMAIMFVLCSNDEIDLNCFKKTLANDLKIKKLNFEEK